MELSKRDQFAMAFMTAWVGRFGINASVDQVKTEVVAKKAYEIADAMIDEAHSTIRSEQPHE